MYHLKNSFQMGLTKKKFKDIKFPPTYKYSSDSDYIPLEFYLEVFPVAERIDLLLGYFSTNAFKVLATGFAQFIHNGGSLRIVTNHILSQTDKENLFGSGEIDDDDLVINIFEDIEKLTLTISEHGQHFFDCLKYLKSKGRLQIVPVKFNGVDLAHCKKMILFDGEDYISTDGSINFTLSALTKNSESFEVNAPWEGAIFERRTDDERQNFEKIINGNHQDYKYLDVDEVESIIDKIGRTKEELELVEDAFNLDFSKMAEKVKKLVRKKRYQFDYEISKELDQPHFPFETGPRDYQEEAYERWKSNGYSGVFAMATGTGKTITSLNCVLQEFKKSKNNTYNFIVLVPTISLAEQWLIEVSEKFNFQNTLVCSSINKWDEVFQQYGKELMFGIKTNFCIITTYATFRGKKFQQILNNYFDGHHEKLTLIADEAHTFGAPKLLDLLPHKIKRRIALSATPERVYDSQGERKLFNFFNAYPPNYTFKYDMKKAIEEGVLCKYFYYPRFVDLKENELIEYKIITKKLYKYIDSKSGKYKDLPEVTNLLIRRKSVIHKAENKIDCLDEIVSDIGTENFKFAFIYVPEGFETDYSENDKESWYKESWEEERKIIDQYAELLNEKYNIKLRKFLGGTKDRDKVLNEFEEGKLDTLLAMKCLDEGVDVPRAQFAVFCSSTGNPRQYVQRRGRILRKHKKKEKAFIYDMIVKPPNEITNTDSKVETAEKSIFEGELRRLVNFASLAENKIEILDQIQELANQYDIDVYEMLNKELDKYEI